MAKSCELETLNCTLKRQDWGNLDILQDALLQKVRMENSNPRNIAYWAKKIIQNNVEVNTGGQCEMGLSSWNQ